MNNELFTYIGAPIIELNKEIKMQDQRVVLLFSYIFNEFVSIDNQLSDNINKIDKISYLLTDINDHVSKIELRLGKVDKKANNIVSMLNEKSVYNTLNDNETEDKSSILNNIWTYIKEKTIKIYKIIYRFLFKYKIKRDLEKKKKMEIEEANRKLKEQNEKIKKLLINGYQAK